MTVYHEKFNEILPRICIAKFLIIKGLKEKSFFIKGFCFCVAPEEGLEPPSAVQRITATRRFISVMTVEIIVHSRFSVVSPGSLHLFGLLPVPCI
jgi:hypothetical protein